MRTIATNEASVFLFIQSEQKGSANLSEVAYMLVGC